jgi:hypothetical protein
MQGRRRLSAGSEVAVATRFAPLPGQWRCEQADADAAKTVRNG